MSCKVPSYMQRQKFGPRAEYRCEEGERVKQSASLAEKFAVLKSLTVDVEYFGPVSLAPSSEVRYTVNLTHAKSVFRFDCPNQECVRGDFDLSAALGVAIAAGHTSAAGEIVCQGWRNKATIDKVSCGHVLRYKLTVEYY